MARVDLSGAKLFCGIGRRGLAFGHQKHRVGIGYSPRMCYGVVLIGVFRSYMYIYIKLLF